MAGALAAALVCGGAVAVAISPASARPYGDCNPVQTYTITNVSPAWMDTTLTSGQVRGPGKATIPRGANWKVMTLGGAGLWNSGDIQPVWAKVNALYRNDNDLFYSGGEYTLSAKSVAVPRGQSRRLRVQILGRKFTVNKYAATNRVTCARGRLLYSVTVTAPLENKKAVRYEDAHLRQTLRYVLV